MSKPIAYQDKGKKLIVPQVRTMLHLLGVDFKDQSNSATENAATLRLLKDSVPERYEQAWRVVVDGVIGECGDGIPKRDAPVGDIYEIVSKLMRDDYREMSESAEKALQASFGALVGGTLSDIESKVQDAIQAATGQFRKIKVQIGEGPDREITGKVHAQFEKVLRKVSAGLPVLLTGPTGSGKTKLAEQVAEATGRRFAAISCSEGMSEGQLLGYLLPIGDAGRFEYVQSQLVDFVENGGVFLQDELDSANPNVMMVTQSLLANGFMSVPQRYNNPSVKAHQDFSFIGCANTMGEGSDLDYTARNKLDKATLDRFACSKVFIDYDRELEREIVTDSEVLEWGHNLRDKIASVGVERTVSTRNMIHMTQLKRAGETMDEIVRDFTMSWSDDEKALCGVAQ